MSAPGTIRACICAYCAEFGLTPRQLLGHSVIGTLLSAGVLVILALVPVMAGGAR